MKFTERTRTTFKKALPLMLGDTIQITYTDSAQEKHTLMTESVTKFSMLENIAIFDVENAEELGFKNKPIAVILGEKL